MRRALSQSTPSWVLPDASLDIDFVRNRAWAGGSASLASLLSTSRASVGMAQRADGSWVSFAANAPRITDSGLLIEQAGTNAILYSNDPSQVAAGQWTNNINVTVAGSVAMGPDNFANSAGSFADNAANGNHLIATASLSFTSGTTYTFSGYFKAGTATVVQLAIGTAAFSGAGFAVFNLSGTGSVNIGGTGLTAAITAIGNGWYRCAITETATATATATLRVVLTNNNPAASGFSPSYAGSGQTAYMWCAQLEALGFATSPIPTNAATATRAADVITLVGGGLAAALNAKAARTVSTLASYNGGQNKLIIWNGTQDLAYHTNTSVAMGNGTSGAQQSIPSGAAITGLVKTAAGFDSSSLTVVVNGSAKITAAIAIGPLTSPANIGNNASGTSALDGYLLRATLGSAKGQFDNLTTGGGL